MVRFAMTVPKIIARAPRILILRGGALGDLGWGFWHAVNEHSSSATAAAAFDVALNLDRESMGLY